LLQNPPLVAHPVIVVLSSPIWMVARELPASDAPERTWNRAGRPLRGYLNRPAPVRVVAVSSALTPVLGNRTV
jgi:hypothetical protein